LDLFEELPDHLLNDLGDEDLIAYLRQAREARNAEAMRAAISVLVFGYWDALVGRARLKLPEADAEDVAGEAVVSAIAAAFDGQSVGEFRSWLHTILNRRIADYHETRKRRPPTDPLPDDWGDGPSVGFEGDALFAAQCLDRAYDEIDERHRRVIDLHLYGRMSARETAEKVGGGMTELNVHQIVSRFRRRFMELFAQGDTSG